MAQIITVPSFRVLPVQVVLPVPTSGPNHRFTLQTTRRPRTMLSETSNALRTPSDAPATGPPRSRPDGDLVPSGRQCPDDLDLSQPMTPSSLLRLPLDFNQSPGSTTALAQQPWLLRPHRYSDTSAPAGVILDNPKHDLSPKETIVITNQVPAVGFESTAGPTQVSIEDASSLNPSTSSDGLPDYHDDNAQYCMDAVHMMDTDGATGGK